MKNVFAVMAVLALLGLGVPTQAVTIATVPVGDKGNIADTRVMNDGTSDYGSVAYDYYIGKYEVTARQYTEFLNAKAVTDPYGLYNTAMGNPSGSWGCNIQRIGAPGSYTYTVASDWANRPVNYVNFWDACRFANWLNNGQGTGDTESGAYTLTTSGIANNTVVRNAGWKWAVTSEDEWYKAAYYKGGSTNAGYWLFPTGSNALPGRDLTDVSGNNANYHSNGYLIGSPYYRTEIGEFQNSDSPYGTFDQGGNMWEWNEAIIRGRYRGLRSGSFNDYDLNLQASFRHYSYQMYDSGSAGFRVVRIVPEPSSFVALAGGLVSLLALRRSRSTDR